MCSSNSPPSAAEPPTDTAKADVVKKAHGDFHFEQLTVPGLFSEPILPLWMSRAVKRATRSLTRSRRNKPEETR